jgi:hypothetical protein
MLGAVAAGALTPTVSAHADARDELLAYVLRAAEPDFEAVRDAAALSGSAPLVGLKAEKAPAKKHAKRPAARAAAKPKSDAGRLTAIDTKPASTGRP